MNNNWMIKLSLTVILAVYGFLMSSCGQKSSSRGLTDISYANTKTLKEDTGDKCLPENADEDTIFVREAVDSTDYNNWEAEYIEIDKGALTLKVYDKYGKLRMKFPVGVAMNYGNKRRRGDHRTPEGEFKVNAIQPSSDWTHDFHDGRGEIKGSYGPWFIRLAHPITTMIGIHGTHLPQSIGTRCTEGCIRLHNEDISKLKEKVRKGMIVRIVPGEEDEKVNHENWLTL